MDEKPILSIILPVFNEGLALPSCLDALKFGADSLPAHEILVVDGGSSDKTCEIAAKYGAKVIPAKQKGRAFQMNEGAEAAQGKWFFFVHADSMVSLQACQKLNHIILEKRLVGGCFSQAIDHKSPLYAYFAWTGNVRAKIQKIYYGDQCIFVTKEAFEKAGKYPPIPIMEEVVFTEKLRDVGLVEIQKEKVVSSPRRWEKMGIWKTVLLYSKIRRGFAKGIPPEQLKEIYLDVR